MALAPPSLNTTLAALANILAPALPGVAVLGQPRLLDETATYPMLQLAPWHYRVQELDSFDAGNQVGGTAALGPNEYVAIFLWSPLLAGLDEGTLSAAMHDAVDTAINALLRAPPGLPDAGGTPQVMDAAFAFDANFGQQGDYITYRGITYLGCYMTIQLLELTRS